MTVRPLDILDFPLIARYRNDALTLNSTRALTRGNPLGTVALMAYVNPARNMYSGSGVESDTESLLFFDSITVISSDNSSGV